MLPGHELTTDETKQLLAAVAEVYYRQTLHKQRVYNASNVSDTVFYPEDLVITVNDTTHRVLGSLFDDTLEVRVTHRHRPRPLRW